MTKRNCETCRHFRAAGFDKMGWCNHPKRRTGSEVKILSRSLELPCRDDWNHDLWQGGTDGQVKGLNADQIVAPVLPATPSELTFLASSERRQNPEDVAARGEDVVVGEVTQQFSTNGGAIQGDGFKVGFRKAHEEIRARQRTVREFIKPVYRQPAETRSESNDEISLDSADSLTRFDGEISMNNQPGARSGPIIGEVSPVALGEMGRPFPKLTTFPEDDAIFSSIPEAVEGFDLPLLTKSAAERIVRRSGFDEDDREIKPWNQPAAEKSVEEVARARTAEPLSSSSTIPGVPPVDRWRTPVSSDSSIAMADEGFLERSDTGDAIFGLGERSGRVSGKDVFDFSVFESQPPWTAEPQPYVNIVQPSPADRHEIFVDGSAVRRLTNDIRSEFGQYDRQRHDRREVSPAAQDLPIREARFPREVRNEAELGGGSLESSSSIVTDTENRGDRIEDSESRSDRQYVSRSRESYGRSRVDSGTEIQPEMELYKSANSPSHRFDATAFTDEPIGAKPSPSIPRMCRTCRDFRPAESGDRGWCTNKWAFSHRRMVDAEELPCETTIGRWWLPHDDQWSTAVDISAHSRPTPHLDQWLAQRAVANGEIDSVPPLRRRQRS